MQHKLTTPHKLLNEDGLLTEVGWATDLMLSYNREAIRFPKEMVYEWDYYMALNENYSISVSTATIGTGRRIAMHLLDFKEDTFVSAYDVVDDDPAPFTMPSGIFGEIDYQSTKATNSLTIQGSTLRLRTKMKDYTPAKDMIVHLDITLPQTDKMVIVIPFAEAGRFYYNCKVNCMPVEGFVEYGGRRYEFDAANSMATYDWGRGVWEDTNHWYWGSASTLLNGKPFGFNIGHGFGLLDKATENIIFYNGVGHKIDGIEFQIPGDKIGVMEHKVPLENYMKPWKFVTTDGRLDMNFVPHLDCWSEDKSHPLYKGSHQVFGWYSGTAVLDDGTRLDFENVLGFAEKIGRVWKAELDGLKADKAGKT